MIYKITPIPKPRMTYRDSAKSKQNRIQGMRPCVARYYDFVNQIQMANVWLKPGMYVTFYLPMPKSWSTKKKTEMRHQPHLKRPDLSNLLKALEDAVYNEDSHIWHYAGLEKLWAYEGSINICYP